MVQTEFLGLRISKTLVDLIKEHIELDTHMSVSDFVRDAIRDKLKSEAPELFTKLFDTKKQKDVIFNHNGNTEKKSIEINKPAIPENKDKGKGESNTGTKIDHYF